MSTKQTSLMNLIVIITSLILGVLGLSFVFSDLGNGETSIVRIATTILFFFLSGVAVGFFTSEKWWLSMLIATWSTLFGGILIVLSILKKGSNVFSASGPPYIQAGLIILFLPLLLTLLGGYMGNTIHRKRSS